jgi:hypothetical protein
MKLLIPIFILLSVRVIAQKKDSLLSVNNQRASEGAQQSIIGDQINALNTQGSYHRTIMPFDTRYEGIKGTYYLIPIWLDGDLYGNRGKLVATHVPIKYDALNKEVIQRNTEKDTIAVYPSAFTLYDQHKTYKFVHQAEFMTTSGKKIADTYMQVLYSKRISFLKNITKSVLLANYKGAFSDNRPYDSFEETIDYFLARENGEIEQIKLNQKSLLHALRGQDIALKNYIKTHNLDLKNEADAQNLIEFYVSLLPEQ